MTPPTRNPSGVFTPGTLLEERAKRGVRPGDDPDLDRALAEMRGQLKPGEDLLYYDPYHRRNDEAPPGETAYVPPTTLHPAAARPVEIADKVVVVVEPSAAERDTEVSARRRGVPPVEPTLLAAQSPPSGPLVAAGLPVSPWRDPRTMLALGVVMAVATALVGVLFARSDRGETEMAGLALPAPMATVTPSVASVASVVPSATATPNATAMPSATVASAAPSASAPRPPPKAPRPAAPKPTTTSGEVHGAPKF
jgi:hypothetical protein